jgi:hypothetical protein
MRGENRKQCVHTSAHPQHVTDIISKAIKTVLLSFRNVQSQIKEVFPNYICATRHFDTPHQKILMANFLFLFNCYEGCSFKILTSDIVTLLTAMMMGR